MKVFKENPILTIWLLILTAMMAYAMIKVKVEVRVHADEGSKIEIREQRHYGVLND
jgi:hypothetical protein